METETIETFRGRTLEELLPRIREELGPDAIVVRRREGLAGGVGGFFQRRFVEVEARPPLPAEQPIEARNDRATAEGMASPAVRTLIEQAAPFADALTRAEQTVADRAGDVLAAAAAAGQTGEFTAVAEEPAFVPAPPAPDAEAPAFDAGLYGPQPRVAPPAPVEVAPTAVRVADAPALQPHATRAAAAAPPVAPALPAAPLVAPALPAPAAAVTARGRLVTAGLSPGFAEAVVTEAVAHHLPFAPSLPLDELARTALARRFHGAPPVPGGPRTLAFVGGGGSGKSTACAHLARAYAAAGVTVMVIALRTPDGGRTLAAALEPLGVMVLPAPDAAALRDRLAAWRPGLTLIETPAVPAGGADALAADLKTLGAQEIHLAVPATISGAAADELADTLVPAGVTHVVLTHADETARPGAAVELAIERGLPLSYVSTRDGATPAEPAAIARTLLP